MARPRRERLVLVSWSAGNREPRSGERLGMERARGVRLGMERLQGELKVGIAE